MQCGLVRTFYKMRQHLSWAMARPRPRPHFTSGDPFVLRGMYVPAEYLQRAIEDGSLRTGPRAGFEVTYANTRYLPRDAFVALVRRGFAGTTKAGSEAVLEVAQERAQTREVVVAMKTLRGEYEQPNQGYRATAEPF